MNKPTRAISKKETAVMSQLVALHAEIDKTEEEIHRFMNEPPSEFNDIIVELLQDIRMSEYIEASKIQQVLCYQHAVDDLIHNLKARKLRFQRPALDNA
jgi:hypothetical protein